MQEKGPIEEYVLGGDLEYAEKQGWFSKFKDFINGKYFFGIIVVLAIILAFFLGRISMMEDKKIPVRVISKNEQNTESPNGTNSQSANTFQGVVNNNSKVSTPSAEVVVASKSGTKYHYPWCAGAKQISEKNLITFNSIEEARAKGYTPALNCKGLK